MTTECQRIDDNWRIPDALWARLEPLLPPRKRRRTHPGRKPLEWRQVLDGIFYVLRTGCQWKAAPREFGSGSSLHRYFQFLVAKEIFARIWQMALGEYDELQGIQWEWQSIDGTMTKAPLGGEKNWPQSHGSREVGNQAVVAYRWRRRPVGRRRQRCQYA
jgi:transposase